MSSAADTPNPYIPSGPNSPWANVQTIRTFNDAAQYYINGFEHSPAGLAKVLAETGLTAEGLDKFGGQVQQAVFLRTSEVGTPLTPEEKAFVTSQMAKFTTGGVWYKNPLYLAGGAVVLIAAVLWWRHKQAQRPGY